MSGKEQHDDSTVDDMMELLREAYGLGDQVSSVAAAPESTSKQEASTRGEWSGYVGQQPVFDKVGDGRLRAAFFLAEHPDAETTVWSRVYSLGRHAQALQRKGRLAGLHVLVRGSLQGVREVTGRDGTKAPQPVIYCYGLRVLGGETKSPKRG